MTVPHQQQHRHHRPDRLVEHGARTYRIEAGLAIRGAVEIDRDRVLVILERRRNPRRPETWAHAVVLRSFGRAGNLWVARPASVTFPIDQVGALIAALAGVAK